MATFKRVTDTFFASPQLTPEDLDTVAADGFTHVINNRPDAEVDPHLFASVFEAECKARGLGFSYLPVSRIDLSSDIITQTQAVLASQGQKVLAYCRSGTRSTTVWALAEVKAGHLGANDAIERAAQAGYDLSYLQPVLASFETT